MVLEAYFYAQEPIEDSWFVKNFSQHFETVENIETHIDNIDENGNFEIGLWENNYSYLILSQLEQANFNLPLYPCSACSPL